MLFHTVLVITTGSISIELHRLGGFTATLALRCCGEAEGHMSGEAAIPAFIAVVAVVREAAFPAFPAAARKGLPSPALL